jgi:predicted RNA-binding Zn-ribbon protein involved in translation (DUF1610 family)
MTSEMSTKTVTDDGRCPECHSTSVRREPHATHGATRDAMAGMVCELCGWTGGSKSEHEADDVETVAAGSHGTFEVEDDAVDLEAGLVVIESGCPECDAELELPLRPGR